MPAAVNNILFDLDGTLADTAPDLAHALNQLLLEQGRSTLAYELIRPTVSNGGNVMVCNAFGITEQHGEFPALRERFLELYYKHLSDRTTLFPGIPEVLEYLEAAAIPWGIVTNKLTWLTEPLIEALDLQQRTSCIVCGDTIKYKKPHPAPMLHACMLADRKPHQTIYIGDARRDIEAGHNAGMLTLIALYGYLDENDPPADWGADGMISSPLEILGWLNREHI